MKLLFKINNNINDEEKKELIEAYRKLYMQKYGLDIIDGFLTVTNLESKNIVNEDILKEYSDNYNKIVDEVFNNDKTLLVCGYNLIGELICAFRMETLDNKVCKIPEVVFCNEEGKYDNFVECVEYAIHYFKNNGYKKMYLEIPLKEPNLLVRGIDNLGFVENPEDIDIYNCNSYILSKDLV